MKQIITLGFILLFLLPVTGQVNIYSDFSGVFPPAGWTLTEETNWSKSNTREAMGLQPECRLHYDPIFSDTARLISQTLDLTGIDSLHVCFLYSMTSKGWGCTVGVASRSNGGNWHDVWHREYDTYYNADPYFIELLVTNADVGKPGFQVCVYFSPGSSSYNFFDFYLDNLHLFSNPQHEVMMANPGYTLQVGPPYELSTYSIVLNYGRSVENFPAHARLYDLSGNLLHSEDTTITNIYPYAGQALQFNPFTLPSADQCYILKIYTDLAGDLERHDDTVIQEVHTYTHSRQEILMELSTSTGCGYCPAAEKGIDSMIVVGDRIGVVAYHTAYADPYENTYSINRVNNYGFWGMPTVYTDGDLCMVGVYPGEPMFTYYQQYYNELKDKKTPFGITFNGTNTGNHYSIQLTVDRYAPSTNQNLVVQCVLTEDGLSFADPYNWVERLMMPDENGTSLDLGAGQQIIPLAFDLDPSWILDNLSLVAFIQDNDTRRVLDAVHLPLTELYPLGGKEITASNNFSLQISPNPFKNKTAIRVRLSEPGDVTAIICDLTGKNEKTLCQQKLASGIHQFFWDGTDDAGAMMPAGIYICRIIAGNSFSSEKLILIR